MDTTTIAAAKRGDADATADLLTWFGQEARSWLTGCALVQRFDLDDVIQEATCEFWGRWLRNYNPEKSAIRTYVWRCLDGFLLDFARRRRNWPISQQGGPPDIADDQNHYETTDWHDLLEQLPADLAEVIDLRFRLGFSMRQAANQLGVSVGTVCRRQKKALEVFGDLGSF